jgi:hypothetical protein
MGRPQHSQALEDAVSLFADLDKNTLACLERIEAGRVRWAGTSSKIFFTTRDLTGDEPKAQFTRLAQRFYWCVDSDSDGGPVILTDAGRAELAALRAVPS